jgi:hypothetical protein
MPTVITQTEIMYFLIWCTEKLMFLLHSCQKCIIITSAWENIIKNLHVRPFYKTVDQYSSKVWIVWTKKENTENWHSWRSQGDWTSKYDVGPWTGLWTTWKTLVGTLAKFREVCISVSIILNLISLFWPLFYGNVTC